MAKTQYRYVCSKCNKISQYMMGKCPSCGEFDTFVREEVAQVSASSKTAKRKQAFSVTSKPELLANIQDDTEPRIPVPIGEFNRVLGGGIVPGSLTLIGGDPGIGKSTILTQMSAILADEYRILYVSAEESVRQIKMRASRLGLKGENLYICSEPCIEIILEHIRSIQPDVVVIDSIQTVYTETVESAPGKIAQVNECAYLLQNLAKLEGVSIFIIGHVTKDGQIAGPQTLSHLVDTVLYLEGDQFQMYRLLRAVKNRFGSVNEVGVFSMESGGLVEVPNPSAVFISERDHTAHGSIVGVSMEGTRPILVEIQALVSMGSGGGVRRMVNGLDYNRMIVVSSVLQKRASMKLWEYDIITNVVGGMKVNEPAADLPVALAIWSSLYESPIPDDLVAIGEIGLNGEIRAVNQIPARLNEVVKLGFKRAMIPSSVRKNIEIPKGLEIIYVRNVTEVIDFMKQYLVEREDDFVIDDVVDFDD